MRRVSVQTLRERKGARFAMVTAYDAAFARLAEQAGIDWILIGDSVGMVVHGRQATTGVSLEEMCLHTAAVRRGTSTAHLTADLPFGATEASDEDAVRSAVALVKAGAASVKLEGARASRIAAIVEAQIPVVGHLGVLPQTAESSTGFRKNRDRDVLLAHANAVQDAGASALVLEMVDAEIASEITRELSIPTIGIGSGGACDGQVLVMHDLLGLYPNPPPFAKRFLNLDAQVMTAFSAFRHAVQNGTFP